MRFVVVAVPEMVRPPVLVPLPIVVEAYEVRPLLNDWSAEKVFAVKTFGIVEELVMYESTRALVKYRFVPSATLVVRSPKVEVAKFVRAPVPPFDPRSPYEKVVAPVPPFETVRAVARVSAPFEAKDDVAD